MTIPTTKNTWGLPVLFQSVHDATERAREVADFWSTRVSVFRRNYEDRDLFCTVPMTHRDPDGWTFVHAVNPTMTAEQRQAAIESAKNGGVV